MPKWISIDEAAHKYGVKEEDICLWAEMEAITASFTETTLIIDEKSLQRFIYLRKNLPTTGYIRTLEQLCINQSEVCKLYMEVIELQEKDLQYKKPALSECAKTIDELEELTGLDFFHNLPDNLENAVESKYAISAWTGLQ